MPQCHIDAIVAKWLFDTISSLDQHLLPGFYLFTLPVLSLAPLGSKCFPKALSTESNPHKMLAAVFSLHSPYFSLFQNTYTHKRSSCYRLLKGSYNPLYGLLSCFSRHNPLKPHRHPEIGEYGVFLFLRHLF